MVNLCGLLILLKWLPKITIFYMAFSVLVGLVIIKPLVWMTLFFDMMDYLPI